MDISLIFEIASLNTYPVQAKGLFSPRMSPPHIHIHLNCLKSLGVAPSKGGPAFFPITGVESVGWVICYRFGYFQPKSIAAETWSSLVHTGPLQSTGSGPLVRCRCSPRLYLLYFIQTFWAIASQGGQCAFIYFTVISSMTLIVLLARINTYFRNTEVYC